MTSTARDNDKAGEVPRKVLHLLVALGPLLVLYVGRPVALLAIVPLAVMAVAADVARSRIPSFEAWIQAIFGFMMRPSESVSGRITINGATWVLVSFALLLLFCPLDIAAQAMFIFILSDAFAAVIGQRFGRHHWPRSRRTIEGTAAFIVVGIGAAILFPGLRTMSAFPAVLAGAAAEIPERPFNDNLRLPVVIGAVLLATRILGF